MSLLPILNDSFIKKIQFNNKLFNTTLDNNYCIINLKNETVQLSLFIVNNRDIYDICRINFYAFSSNLLFSLIYRHHTISQYISLSHALYIGKEIYKAELSKVLKQTYLQL